MIRIPISEDMVRREPLTDVTFRAADNGGGVFGGIGQGLEGVGRVGLKIAEDEAADRSAKTKAAAAVADPTAPSTPDPTPPPVPQPTQLHIDQLDDAGAKTLDASFVDRISPIRDTYFSQQGLAATAGRGEAEQLLGRVRDDVLSRATTPTMYAMTRRVLDLRTSGEMADIGAHALQQLGVADDQASLARQSLSADEAANARDPQMRQINLQTGINEIITYAGRKGWTPEATRAETTRYASGVHADVIGNRLDAGDLDGALAYRAAQAPYLTDSHQRLIDAQMQGPLAQRQGEADADGVMGAATRTGAPFTYSDPLHGAGTGIIPQVDTMGGPPNGVALSARPGVGVYPTAPGTVASVGGDASTGQQVVIDHGDGSSSTYSQLGSVSAQPGDKVGPDTLLGASGTNPVHWTMDRDGQPVDADTLTNQARQPEQVHDLPALLGRIDSQATAEDWSSERIERAKGEVLARVSRDTLQRQGQQDSAKEAALNAIDRLGKGYTSLAQLPATVTAALAPDVANQLNSMAQAHRLGLKAQPDGETAMRLNLLAIQNRQEFLDTDLRLYRHELTHDEFAGLSKLQGDAQSNPAALATHEAIWSTILRHAPRPDGSDPSALKPDATTQAEAQHIFTLMSGRLAGGSGLPTTADIDAAFDQAARSMKVGSDWLGQGANPAVEDDGEEAEASEALHSEDVARFLHSPAVRRFFQLDDPSGADPTGQRSTSAEAAFIAAPYQPGTEGGLAHQIDFLREARSRFGGNSGASPFDPMTLQQIVGLPIATPGGIAFSIADNVFDLTGPANEAVTALYQGQKRSLIQQIKAIDPHWIYYEIGETPGGQTSRQGQINEIDDLRAQRAALIYRQRGDAAPLKVETLRRLQTLVDQAYADGVKRYEAGRLGQKLNQNEAIGNYVDRQVRNGIKEWFNQYSVSVGVKLLVGVNNRTYAADGSYRIPDARVSDTAFDWTLSPKHGGLPQVRGFFNAKFQPTSVIIVRPTQLKGPYIIPK